MVSEILGMSSFGSVVFLLRNIARAMLVVMFIWVILL